MTTRFQLACAWLFLLLLVLLVPLVERLGSGTSLVLLGLAAFKGLIIGEGFMRLATAPWRWRLLVPVWLLSVVGCILMLGGRT